jgi:hypothetical protein
MDKTRIPRHLLVGGLAGIIGTICYIIAIAVPVVPSIGFILVTLWPVFSIIFRLHCINTLPLRGRV